MTCKEHIGVQIKDQTFKVESIIDKQWLSKRFQVIFYITKLISSWSGVKIPRTEVPSSRSRPRPTPSRSITRSRTDCDLETGLVSKSRSISRYPTLECRINSSECIRKHVMNTEMNFVQFALCCTQLSDYDVTFLGIGSARACFLFRLGGLFTWIQDEGRDFIYRVIQDL